jgi:hypothetical protein
MWPFTPFRHIHFANIVRTTGGDRNSVRFSATII